MKLSRLLPWGIPLLLFAASLFLYVLDYLLYGKRDEIIFGFFGNLAFLPVYVLFVTLMIERVLKQRERMAMRRKLNMVIGVFFSELGTKLISDCAGFVTNFEEVASRLRVSPQWREEDYRRALQFLDRSPMHVESREGDLAELKTFLTARREFMLGLLENPNLLEHDEFTDLLWAVFHLMEELEARQAVTGLPEADMDHLSGDIRRVFGHLVREWVTYIRHLQHDYPYLFSLAVRQNPLDPQARIVLS